MRCSRIYTNTPLSPKAEQLSLDDKTTHYIKNVLRLKAGDCLELFDGLGYTCEAQVSAFEKKHCLAVINADITRHAPPFLEIHSGLCLSKGDRMDFALQKAVELGVSQITPLWSRRCDVKLNEERMEKKMAHWQQVVIHACEQCGQNFLPVLNPPVSIQSWLPAVQAQQKYICTPGQACAFHSGEKTNSVVLATGPEGGFEHEEIELAQAHGFIATGLGPRVLRTETAPIVALSLLQYLWGDITNAHTDGLFSPP